RDGTQWSVTFSCLVDVPPLAPCDDPIALDLGTLRFATFHTGEQVENPRHIRRAEKRLRRKQQQLARGQRGSKRRERRKQELRGAHRHVRNARADFLHKLSRRLVNAYGVIIMEDLAIANLVKRPAPKVDAAKSAEVGAIVYAPNGAAAKSGLNKSILDAGWGMFAQMCSVKAGWAGRTVRFVDPRYTSQRCSGCGERQHLELATRWYSCPQCGLELDRDQNAAINILRAGSRACAETPASQV
ncbi:MAG TPA: transposase, partial [Chloroflexia bacterium]|nr:transposase [Chloroflexia bacterium]